MKTQINLTLILFSLCLSHFSFASSTLPNSSDNRSIRVHVNINQAVELTIQKNAESGVAVISANYQDYDVNDIFASYLLDGSYLNAENEVTLPTTSSRFWRIYLDYENYDNPVSVYAPTGGMSIEISCKCVTGIMGDSDCGSSGDCDTNGSIDGCVTCCATTCTCDCMPKEVKGGILIIEASSVVFNGTHYQVTE